MIPGARATTILFATADQVRGPVLTRGWPWLGAAGAPGSREVFLSGSRPRRFPLRVSEARARGKIVACQVDLYDADHVGTVVMRAQLTFAPNGRSTSVSLQGSVGPGLTPPASTRTAVSLRVANEYARALLEQISRDIEACVRADRAAPAAGGPA